jgi:hypothetical protein
LQDPSDLATAETVIVRAPQDPSATIVLSTESLDLAGDDEDDDDEDE